MKLLLITTVIFFVGCSTTKYSPPAGFELAVIVPEVEYEVLQKLESLSQSQVNDYLEKYGVFRSKADFPEAPDTSFGHFICGTIFDDGFVPGSYLDDKPHIKFKTLGVGEEWVPINGEPKRYLVFKVND